MSIGMKGHPKVKSSIHLETAVESLSKAQAVLSTNKKDKETYSKAINEINKLMLASEKIMKEDFFLVDKSKA